MEEERLDYYLVSPSDFTVQVQNLPPQYTEADISKLIYDWWESRKSKIQKKVEEFKIEKICIAYEIKDFLTKVKEKDKVNLQLRKNDYYEKKNHVYPKGQDKQSLLTERQQLQQEIDQLEAKVFNNQYDKRTPICFVTFNTRKSLDALLDSQERSNLQNTIRRLKFSLGYKVKDLITMKQNGKTYIIKITRAPEPTDINWENCGSTTVEKYQKRFITWICALLLLGACFCAIYFIKKWQIFVNRNNQTRQNTTGVKAKLEMLSLFVSLSILIINLLLKQIIKLLARFELASTVTKVNISIAEKLSLAQFVNSALIILAVNYSIDSDNFWGDGGIANDFTLTALVNCILPPIITLLNPKYLIRVLKRQIIKKDENGKYSQGEANKQFEGDKLDIASKYASCMKTLWMIGFYTPLSPYLPLFGIATIFLRYWADKYVLLSRQSRPDVISNNLNREMIELVEYFPFTVAIGNLVWMQQLGVNDRDSLILMLVAVGLSVFNFLIPQRKLNKQFFKVKDIDDHKKTGTYESRRLDFQNDYDRSNPITKEEAINQYYRDLQVVDRDAANNFIMREKNKKNFPHKLIKNFATIKYHIQGNMSGQKSNNQKISS